MHYSFNSRDIKIALKTALLFLLLGPFITLVHESGHWILAYFFGFDPVLHFGSVSYENLQESQPYSVKLKQKLHFAVMGGPLQNMFLGSIGFFLFLKMVSTEKLSYPLKPKAWLLIFISLLWARQIVIAFYGVLSLFLDIELKGDEARLAEYWGLPAWAVFLPTGIVGSIIGLTILFYFPKNFRIHFIVGGGLGSIVGMGLWYRVLGPVLLP